MMARCCSCGEVYRVTGNEPLRQQRLYCMACRADVVRRQLASGERKAPYQCTPDVPQWIRQQQLILDEMRKGAK